MTTIHPATTAARAASARRAYATVWASLAVALTVAGCAGTTGPFDAAGGGPDAARGASDAIGEVATAPDAATTGPRCYPILTVPPNTPACPDAPPAPQTPCSTACQICDHVGTWGPCICDGARWVCRSDLCCDDLNCTYTGALPACH